MMLRMMEEVSRITGKQRGDLGVCLQPDMVEYGHVLPKPREQIAWFDGLPKSLQDRMIKLGATRETFTL